MSLYELIEQLYPWDLQYSNDKHVHFDGFDDVAIFLRLERTVM